MDDSSLIARYIDESPVYGGIADARLRDYGVSVWALVAYYLAADGSIDVVAHDYDVPREAVQAVLAYYRRHQCFVDARIHDHEAAFS